MITKFGIAKKLTEITEHEKRSLLKVSIYKIQSHIQTIADLIGSRPANFSFS